MNAADPPELWYWEFIIDSDERDPKCQKVQGNLPISVNMIPIWLLRHFFPYSLALNLSPFFILENQIKLQ